MEQNGKGWEEEQDGMGRNGMGKNRKGWDKMS